jgi:hypothetical protein
VLVNIFLKFILAVPFLQTKDFLEEISLQMIESHKDKLSELRDHAFGSHFSQHSFAITSHHSNKSFLMNNVLEV